MKNLYKKILIAIFLVIVSLTMANFALATDASSSDAYGMQYGDELGLSKTDPRVVIVNIIKIALTFLGVIAVGLALYAGFLWMTSAGNEEKVEKAKKILSGTVIGIIIILASWAIVSFVMKNMNDILNNGSNSSSELPGGSPWDDFSSSFYLRQTQPENNSQDNFINTKVRLYFSKNIGYETINTADLIASKFNIEKIAEINFETGEELSASGTMFIKMDTLATTTESISFNVAGSCGKETGDTGNCFEMWKRYRISFSQSAFLSEGGLSMGNDREVIQCENGNCQFEFTTNDLYNDGNPVIFDLSPRGGFCTGDTDKPCQSDENCLGIGDGKCDLITANAAKNNFITISGVNFGYTAGQVQFCANFSGTSSVCNDWGSIFGSLANDSANGNANCDSSWTNNQIIAVVPEGINLGKTAVKVSIGEGDEFFDTTEDARGRKIDFIINNIIRPGVCELSNQDTTFNDSKIYACSSDVDCPPFVDCGATGLCEKNHGAKDNKIDYLGVNLSGDEIYYGQWPIGNVKAAAINFSSVDKKTADAIVPGLETGKTSSFVVKNINGVGVISNSLEFVKDIEPPVGPSIVYFTPTEGKKDQYVTIFGEKFGKPKSAQVLGMGCNPAQSACYQVYLASKSDIDSGKDGMAVSFSFPDVCLDSLWQDNSVTVKVPELPGNGEYYIKMKIPKKDDKPSAGYWVIDSSKIIPTLKNKPLFKYDQSLALTPSLCKLSPKVAQNESQISLYGEYFGSKDTGAVKFYSDKIVNSFISENWKLGTIPAGFKDKVDMVVATVPNDANSGPVVVLQGAISSNELNIEIGSCLLSSNPNSACGGAMVCCASGSSEEGVCKNTVDECFTKIKSSVYEWSFNTGTTPGALGDPCGSSDYGGLCKPSSDDCQDGFQCNESNCTCEPAGIDSCSGYSNLQCSDSYLCPNSPGKCSSSVGKKESVGNCDSTCNDIPECSGDKCTYNAVSDKCSLNNYICDLNNTNLFIDALGASSSVYCAQYNGKSVWLMDTKLSCPVGWVKTPGKNICVNETASCNLCAENFACSSSGTTGSKGICSASKDICPQNSVCENNKCMTKVDDSCDCCCRVDSVAQDCCSGLTCGGSCGAGTDSEGKQLGLCSGCAGTPDPDAACNCTGTTGKFCDDSDAGFPTGACKDCAAITDPAECSQHEACCVDGMDGNVCRGVDEKMPPADQRVENKFNYCGYFECRKDASGNPVTGTCVAPVVSSTFITAATSTASCLATCSASTGGVGESCNVAPAGEAPACDPFACVAGYSCVASDVGCGNCCCDVTKANTNQDTCRNISPNLYCGYDININSSCYDNLQGSAPTTPDFGICCGCADDSQCGDKNTDGCSSDTCCRARPSIESTVPVNNSTGVCRNSVISATFDQEMDVSSFSKNVIVVSEQTNDCPSGKYLTFDNSQPIKRNIFARVFISLSDKVKRFFDSITGNSVFATAPSVGKNYCAIAGAVTGEKSGDKTILNFRPLEALSSETIYFIIVKGDINLTDANDDGVLSKWKVGMNGGGYSNVETYKFNGLNFVNSQIWGFKTSKDICNLSRVEINPASKLFQTSQNNVNIGSIDDACLLGGDDDQNNPACYDSLNDADKVFIAQGFSEAGQKIAPTPGYDWTWSWSVENEAVVKLKMGENNALETRTVVAQGVQDDNTYVNVTAKLTKGGELQSRAQVFVLVCENPWPRVRSDGTWSPWRDVSNNCGAGGSGCSDYNYDLYYCRDAGEKGTADDLPAVLDEDTITRGKALTGNCSGGFYGDKACASSFDCVMPGVAEKISCSSGKCINTVGVIGGSCSSNNDCRESGTCSSIMKESYFFREKSPEVSGNFLNKLEAAAYPELDKGGEAALWWNDVADASEYILYYDTDSQWPYAKNIKVLSSSVHTISNPFLIKNLINKQKYYFALTAKNAQGVESKLSNEVSYTPIDNIGPISPKINKATKTGEKLSLEWTDRSASDAVSFRLFKKSDVNECINSTSFGDSQVVLSSPISLVGIKGNIDYCLGLKAYDINGKESNLDKDSLLMFCRDGFINNGNNSCVAQ